MFNAWTGTLVLLSALALPVSAQVKVSPARGIVVDATSRTVGYFHPGGVGTLGVDPGTMIRVGQQLVHLPLKSINLPEGGVDTEKLVPAEYGQIPFDGPDCTGRAYLPGGNAFLAGGTPSFILADGFGRGVIYIGSSAPFTPTVVRSTFISYGRCQNYADAVIPAKPVETVIDLSAYFTPPYSVK